MWTVSKETLNEKKGVFGLPVRRPERYCADIFRDLLGSLGIYVEPKNPVSELPIVHPTASHQSIPMNETLIHILRYSINLIAEIVSITATQ